MCLACCVVYVCDEHVKQVLVSVYGKFAGKKLSCLIVDIFGGCLFFISVAQSL